MNEEPPPALTNPCTNTNTNIAMNNLKRMLENSKNSDDILKKLLESYGDEET